MKPSNKRFCIAPALVLFSAAANAAWAPQSHAPAMAPMFMRPVPGLTSAPHEVPHETSIPVGAEVTFWQPFDQATATVAWQGVLESESTAGRSYAQVRFDRLGRHVVSASIVDAEGHVHENRSVFRVIDVSVEEIRFGPVAIEAARIWNGEALSNATTKRWIEEVQSLAPVHRRPDGRFVTSTWRELSLRARTEPAGFEPLMEWRLDGVVMSFGQGAPMYVPTKGEHVISVGTDYRESTAVLEAYEVSISSSSDSLPASGPITFTAVTDPVGYEDGVTWLASSDGGAVFPLLGHGSSFTVVQGGAGLARSITISAGPSRLTVSNQGLALAIQPVSTKPVILSNFPTTSQVGGMVTLTGTGFSGDLKEVTVWGEVPGGQGFLFRPVAITSTVAIVELKLIGSGSVSAPITIRKGAMGSCQQGPIWVHPGGMGSIDPGIVRTTCAPDNPQLLGRSPQAFFPDAGGGPGADAVILHPFTITSGGQLQLLVPSVSAGQSGLLGLAWIRPGVGGDTLVIPDSGRIQIGVSVSASLFGFALASFIQFAFDQNGIPCSVNFDAGTLLLTVGCPQLITQGGFLLGMLLIF